MNKAYEVRYGIRNRFSDRCPTQAYPTDRCESVMPGEATPDGRGRGRPQQQRATASTIAAVSAATSAGSMTYGGIV